MTRFQRLAPLVILLSLVVHPTMAWTSPGDQDWQKRLVPIPGVTLDSNQHPVGVIVDVGVALKVREDLRGVEIAFQSWPGRFSPTSQDAVMSAIKTTAEVANVDTHSWTIVLVFPYPNLTLHGDSLSAMVALAVVALAQDDPLQAHRIITGNITEDGRIGTVGGIPFKIQAAHAQHFQRLLIPEEHYVGDSDWRTPFLMHISPVRTLTQAYHVLTGRPLKQNHEHG